MTEDATLRVFTDKGIDAFQQYLAQLRKDPAIAPPDKLAGRQTLITNRGILDAARLMYFNESGNRPKRGALGREKTPGTLLRFIDVVQQLDLTYDLYSMSGREILKLLPPEFDRWTN